MVEELSRRRHRLPATGATEEGSRNVPLGPRTSLLLLNLHRLYLDLQKVQLNPALGRRGLTQHLPSSSSPRFLQERSDVRGSISNRAEPGTGSQLRTHVTHASIFSLAYFPTIFAIWAREGDARTPVDL